MKEINFITNIEQGKTSGGGGSISMRTYQSIGRFLDVNFVGPINPPVIRAERFRARLLRNLGLRSKFESFSEKRLGLISGQVRGLRSSSALYDLFHSSTSWVGFSPEVRYGTFVDACFSTYMDIYHDRSRFEERDLRRIEEVEANWMSDAAHVFVGSRWAMREIHNKYGIPEDKMVLVRRAGNMTIPERDVFEGGYDFVFVSRVFEKKGGHVAIQALQRLRRKVPGATLTLVGQAPPEAVVSLPGVVYAGLLDRNVRDDAARLQSLMAHARALVHPTSLDTNPLVIAEAGYHGCPAISTRSFGIPELVLDGQTGLLVDAPAQVDDVYRCMLQMCQDEGGYAEMRRAARAYTVENISWETSGRILAEHIQSVL